MYSRDFLGEVRLHSGKLLLSDGSVSVPIQKVLDAAGSDDGGGQCGHAVAIGDIPYLDAVFEVFVSRDSYGQIVTIELKLKEEP